MIQDLHIKYRPQCFDAVIGQDHAINSLKALFSSDKIPHAFLFTGPSGGGKTSISRLIAKELNCSTGNIVELDAASHSGVESIRELTASLAYATFGENPIKFIILDEVHAISKNAWQALLKTLEEPPEHVYFALCTTEADKVPETIKTRCHTYNLKDVSYDDLVQLIEYVAEEESIKLEPKALRLVAQSAFGSPRRALTLLSKCRSCENLDEIRLILEEPDEAGEVIELCRLFAGRTKPQWKNILRILKSLEGQNPESIRLIVVNYTAKVLLNSRNESDATKYLAILEAFSTPFNSSEKFAPLLLACGRLIFDE
jgi:DNA polymerase III subunit gamma/tau